MKKVIAVISLLFFIVYMYVAINTPKPTGYYVGKGEKTLSYNGEDYLYITSMVDEQIGDKLGISEINKCRSQEFELLRAAFCSA